MTISNPSDWQEIGRAKGPKYDKIVEIITALNANTSPRPSISIGANFFNGAGLNAIGNVSILMLPTTDADAGMRLSGIPLPYDYSDNDAVDLKIAYFIDTANAYSVKWSVASYSAGATYASQDFNVLNASTAFDFPAGTTNQIYIKTINLSDTDINVGDILGVRIESDFSNTGNLFIINIWTEDA